DLVEEVHRVGVAAVLTADAELDPGPGPAALFSGDLDEPADALPVEGLERRHAEDPQLQVAAEEGRLDIVPGEPPGGLGEVVGTEGEELSGLGDLPGGDGRPGQLDHGADERGRTGLRQDALSLLAGGLQLLYRPDQRDHDL